MVACVWFNGLLRVAALWALATVWGCGAEPAGQNVVRLEGRGGRWMLIDAGQWRQSASLRVARHWLLPEQSAESTGLTLRWSAPLEDVRVEPLRLGSWTDLPAELCDGSQPDDFETDCHLTRWPDWTVPLPSSAPELPGLLRLGAFNLDNFFLTLESLGARDASELERQATKLANAVRSLDADIVGVVELENASGVGEELLRHLNAGAESPWALVRAARSPGGSHKSALLFRPARVQPVGEAEWLPAVVGGRSPLMQAFDTGIGRVVVVVLHWRSLRCSSRTEDPAGLAGCDQPFRVQEAHALVAALRARSPAPTVIVGDFNALPGEQALGILEADGWTSLLRGLPAETRYSYVFQGHRQLLDQAWATSDLARRLRSSAIWHINADELRDRDYRASNSRRFYAPDARRSSDHDPVVLSFE